MVEGARLESVYTATYRGFESLLLRQNYKKGLLGPFFLSGNNAALAYGDELASCWKHLAINVALVVSINPNNELSVRWFFPYRNQLEGDNRKDE